MENLTKRSLQLAILKVLRSVRHQHKFNLLGKSDAQGDLERQLGIRFEQDQRHLAALAFTELETSGLIRPTYDDLAAPELWVAITESGKAVLAQDSVEALNKSLGSASPSAQEKELEQKFKILYSASQAATDFAKWISDNGNQPMAMVFLDIDNFKALNTAYTETAVDETLLPEFQRHLKSLVRHRGHAYRHGGEEFLIELPNHSKGEAVAFAERVRQDIAGQVFRIGSEEVRLTVSGGVALYPEDGATFAEVIRAANIAEHEAKSSGRNRIVGACSSGTA